jgi:tripartite-type tricarboxylate transporter receptor subunit TctC
MEWVKTMAKIDLTHVPYRGVAPALTDVVAGQVNMMFTGTSSAKPYVDAGKLVPLAVSPATRQASIPQVPSVSETLPGYDFLTWYGLAAPAGTPPEIVARLSREVAAAFNQPDVKERLTTLGVAGTPSAPEEFAKFMKAETEKLGRIVKAAGLKPQ